MRCPYCRKGPLVLLTHFGLVWCGKCNEWMFDGRDDFDP